MKRITKKEQYCNGLRHDIDYFETEITKDKIGFWFLGDFIPKYKARRKLVEYRSELATVIQDKNYKPWKDDFDLDAYELNRLGNKLEEDDDFDPAGGRGLYSHE